MIATGTATDPLTLTATDTATITVSGATGTRRIRRTVFENRVNWGSPTPGFTETQGPTFGPLTTGYPSGPLTMSISFTIQRDCELVAVRFYKAPDLAGTIPFAIWDVAGLELETASLVCVADAGGWREVVFSAVALTAGSYYSVGYHVPDNNYPMSPWVFNAQDTYVYPFLVQSLHESGGLRTLGAGVHTGASLTWPGINERTPHNYYIDPVVEWDDDLPGYSGGSAYYDQFQTAGSSFAFPIAVYFSDPENLVGYAAIGVNTQIAGNASDAYIDAIKASGMDWYPTLHGGDMTAPVAVQEDPVLAAQVRGYHLTDEPDLITPYNSPATVRSWRNAARLRDSSRPILMGLSYNPVKNQGYAAQPPSGDPESWYLDWMEYAGLVDILSCDFYSLAASDSFSQTAFPGDYNRYGIWAYPPQVRRMAELCDSRVPIWGTIESTSQLPDLPEPETFRRGCWALLIAGARGLILFDHRFPDFDVSQDFAAALHNPAMNAMIASLSATLQTLAGALLAPDAGLIEGYSSSGTLPVAQGGYPADAEIPLLLSSRLAGGDSYIFAQSIRGGSTTATISVPSLAGATLTVIGEDRTVEVDGGGEFSDDFDDGDYTVHLYVTGEDPSFTVPANFVLPVITSDGTPVEGETITCSTGSWTGSPTPTFGYQWRRDGVNISGATSSSHEIVALDVGELIDCLVTATNSEGSASAAATTITPDAEVSVYPSVVLADDPIGYWRLSDYTDSSGNGLTLTPSGTVSNADSLLLSEPGSGRAKGFTFAGSSVVSRADESILNPATNAICFEAWVAPSATQTGIIEKGNARLVVSSSGKFGFDVPYLPTGSIFVSSDTTYVSGQSYHVVAQYEAGVTELWVNGVLEDTVSFAATLADRDGPLLIGDSAHGSFFNFSGSIDEVAIYDHALSSGQVIAHYVAGGGLSPYAAAVLEDDPVAYWRMNDLTDSSGNGHTLTASGSPNSVAALISETDAAGAKGFVFDDGDWYSAGDHADFYPSAGATWELWVRPQFDGMALMGKGTGTGPAFLAIAGGGFRMVWDNTVSNVQTDSVTAWIAGEIYHVVATYDGAVSKLYINGVLDNSTIWADTLAANPGTSLFIADCVHPDYPNLTGTLDEVAVYDHALSAARVLAHYEAGTA